MYQQHRRLSPPPFKPHHRYLSGRPQGLPVPSPCLLHSTSAPASPVHPLCPHPRLQRTMVRSGSRPADSAPGPCTARASTCQHLPAPGPLPHHGRGTGPDSRAGAAAGFTPDQRSAEVSQQPRRTQPEDHVGLGVRAGLNPSPNGLDWTGLDCCGVLHARSGPERMEEAGGAWRARKSQTLTCSRGGEEKSGM